MLAGGQSVLVDPFSFVLEFVCLSWSEVCSARVTSLLLILLVGMGVVSGESLVGVGVVSGESLVGVGVVSGELLLLVCVGVIEGIC